MGARGASASSEAADVVILVDRLGRVADAVVIAKRARAIALQSIDAPHPPHGSPQPLLGVILPAAARCFRSFVAAFQKGLSESGYVEGHNVAIEFRWARDDSARLVELVADLVHRRVEVIFAGGGVGALAAKRATTDIPIVFSSRQARRPVMPTAGKLGGRYRGDCVAKCPGFARAARGQHLHNLLARSRTRFTGGSPF
jgi:hypothetical protein